MIHTWLAIYFQSMLRDVSSDRLYGWHIIVSHGGHLYTLTLGWFHLGLGFVVKAELGVISIWGACHR